MQALRKFKIAILQTKASKVKEQTLGYVQEALEEAGKNGAKVSILGETFNCLYMKEYCQAASENFSDSSDKTPTLNLLKEYAKKYNMFIIGSIPEKTSDDKLYNTGIAINSDGQLSAIHRKIHLFDINIPGRAVYKESDTFSSGNQITVLDTGFCKIGLGICYDIRFAEQALVMCQKQGAQVLVYPGSFAMGTGPIHWELLLRARAIDNLAYVVGSCCARFTEDPSVYQAWGHSTLVDPFGKVLTTTDHDPTILYGEIDLDYLDQVRQQIPIYKQKRYDLYEVVHKIGNQ
ncbi:hypothetical protein ABPG74_012581 [Tetrahymena malaccensis]